MNKAGEASGLASWLFAGIRLPLVLGAAALFVYALLFASPYDLRVLTLCGIYALLVLGFQFVFGYAGAVSLAQATFFGIGGYITGILATRFGLPFLITFPLSIAGPALLAIIIAVPVLKLEDHYFSLATLGIGLVVLLLAIQWSDVTGGANGFAGIPAIELPGFDNCRSPLGALVRLGRRRRRLLLAYQVTRGLHGHALHLMRENREAASSLGLNIAELRFGAFVLSAAYGGAAGALMAHVIHVVSPENLDLALMVTILTMAVIGGRTHIAGAILGALPDRVLARMVSGPRKLLHDRLWHGRAGNAHHGALRTCWRDRAIADFSSRLPAPRRHLSRRRRCTRACTSLLRSPRTQDIVGSRRCRAGVWRRESARRRTAFLPGRVEIVGLIGPNGSGKTTLLNVISGLYSLRSRQGYVS